MGEKIVTVEDIVTRVLTLTLWDIAINEALGTDDDHDYELAAKEAREWFDTEEARELRIDRPRRQFGKTRDRFNTPAFPPDTFG